MELIRLYEAEGVDHHMVQLGMEAAGHESNRPCWRKRYTLGTISVDVSQAVVTYRGYAHPGNRHTPA